MGWTSTNYDKERDGGVAGFFTREMLPYEVLDSALVARTTWYAAVRLNGVVSGVVVKIQWSAKRADFNITFKDMSECEGPYAFECPERILKLLTPLPPLPPEGESDPDEYARNWRFRNWERILALKAAPKVQVGDLLEFETPFKFEGWGQLKVFRVCSGKNGRGIKLFSPQTGTYCRIGNWRELPFKVLAAI